MHLNRKATFAGWQLVLLIGRLLEIPWLLAPQQKSKALSILCLLRALCFEVYEVPGHTSPPGCTQGWG